MTKYTTYLSMIALAMNIIPTKASFDFPTNIDFVTHMYNTSNCSNTSIRNISLNHFCYDTRIINGYPNCCNKLLPEVSLFENISFGQCVGFNMNNMPNLTGLKYSCNLVNINQFNTVEALSYIGLCSMFFLAILLIGCIMYYICYCGRSRSYNRV